MSLRDTINSAKKPLSVSTLTGLAVAGIAFLTLHITLSDRLRGEGAQDAEIDGRVRRIEQWVADYEKNVRPLRDEFLRLTGELKRLPEQIADLKTEMRRLNDRLDRMEMAGARP